MQINKYLNDYQIYIENKLSYYLEKYAGNSPLYDAMCYSTLGGGKRIRPIIVYTIGASYGVAKENLDSAACALELIHCYSLVHDDLPAMDDDDFRRGKLSCHKKFDEATAILVGDALQTLAFEILAVPNADLSPITQLCMIKTLAAVSGSNGIVGGQTRDIKASIENTSLKDIDKIHIEKTASLFDAAVNLATLAYSDKKRNSFGVLLGKAFQLQDDLLEATNANINKPLDSDIKNDKITHHRFIGLENAQKLLEKYYQEAKDKIKAEIPEPSIMLQILELMANRTS